MLGVVQHALLLAEARGGGLKRAARTPPGLYKGTNASRLLETISIERAIRLFEFLAIDLVIRPLGYLVIRLCGSSVIRFSSLSVIRIFDFSAIRLFS